MAAIPLQEFGGSVRASSFRPDYYPLVQTVSGLVETIAILVEFPDQKHTTDKQEVESMIFDEMAGYYSEVSYGQLQIVGQTLGWYELPKTMEYYGADVDPFQRGSDARKGQLLVDAISSVSDPVEFNEDTRVLIVHAGAGQEGAIDDTELIWSEAYWYGLSIPVKDGGVIRTAAIVPERESEGHSPLGVYAHEFGHLLFLPDLYDVNKPPDSPDKFMGAWSLMGTGLWLGDPRGSSPAQLEAWSRIKLGWLVPELVELDKIQPNFQIYNIRPIEYSIGTRAVRVPTAGGGYYLIEFRVRMNSDRYLPEEGILITKVDESEVSGGGIVRVMDENSSSPTLNDALFGDGSAFDDREQDLYVRLSYNSMQICSVLVGNRDPAGVNITTATLSAPASITGIFSQPLNVEILLKDETGRPLPGELVRLQQYYAETWSDISSALTDKHGQASFPIPTGLKPGRYYIRFHYAGDSTAQTYIAGTSQVTELNIAKTPTELTIISATEIQATTSATITVKVWDRTGHAGENRSVLFWLDGHLLRREPMTNGTVTLQINFGLHQIGKHNATIQVLENDFHKGATMSLEIQVSAPAWWPTMPLSLILAALTIAYLAVRRRARRYRVNVQLN